MADISPADISLDDWVAEVAAALGVIDLRVDTDEVLDLASAAAHNVVRPAAPLTTFVAGLAAGLAGGSQDDIRKAIQTAATLCERHPADGSLPAPRGGTSGPPDTDRATGDRGDA